MRKLALLGLIAVIPLSAHASGARGSSHAPSTGRVVARMLQNLRGQSHIRAAGTIYSRNNKPVAHMSFRFASGRESLVLSSRETVVSAGKKSTSQHYVYIGHTMYTSLDGSHWYHGANPSAPSPVDVLALNTNGAYCCTNSGSRAGENVWVGGYTTWNGRRVLKLNFKGATASGTAASGVVYLDPGSDRPLGLQSMVYPSKMTGKFTIAYGGSYSIRTP
ncbi:MAG TPA: hypothetical protein VFB58_14585 [Chloroflexota bacterium]|nr:hypothetical protein [Chloroflexota bacterium]